jgi:hypothetical protein
MTSPARPSAPLRADCIADSAGGLTFDVTADGEPGDAHLLLRRRDGHDEVGLPLAPAAEGRLRAALPSSVALPEGRWDAYARVADAEPRRLVPGVTDLRALAARAPSGPHGRIAVRIPYATRQGNLTVRSWLRALHAEVAELRPGSAALTVHGLVYGTPLDPGAHAELRDGGTGRVHRVEVDADGGAFRLTAAYTALAPGEWELWLCPAGPDGPRVRIARLLDDIADKRPVFAVPRARVDTPWGTVAAGPYYTGDNDLSVSVTTLGPGQAQDST